MIPSVGRIVHYVSYGTPGGEYASQCRAAVVAAVPEGALPLVDVEHAETWTSGTVVCDLVVLNPIGLFFNRCPQSEENHRGGTWHWPERTDGAQQTGLDAADGVEVPPYVTDLLDAFLTGQPLNLHGHPVPAAIQARLDAAHADGTLRSVPVAGAGPA